MIASREGIPTITIFLSLEESMDIHTEVPDPDLAPSSMWWKRGDDPALLIVI